MGLEAAELLALKAAWLEGHGKPFEKEAAMAAMASAEAALNASVEGFRIVGEEGCAKGSPMERHLRDVKMVQVRHGTFESMRSVVSGHLVLGAKRST
jgi:alkylation response protein AidB-like acyl-CoA dehydrogenase